jgi:hypothetical protein
MMTKHAPAPPLSQGSLWRRWDPHVHLPGTLFADEFGAATVEQALDALSECDPQIEAAGITDYWTTAGFRRASAAHDAGSGARIAFLFPNVELRLEVQVASGSGVNIHLLTAPEDVDWLDGFLSRLEFTYHDRPYRADVASLTNLGRAFLGQPKADPTAALREGANQFKVTLEQLRDAYRRDPDGASKLLVAVPGNESDGTSGVRTKDGAFTAVRQSIERFAHIIFSPNQQQREFWLGRRASDSPADIARVYRGLKPCLHGSDAHSMDKLGRPDDDRYTWIKGDPNFETLRHATLAPESRVWVGSTSPADGTEPGRIVSVSVPEAPWFGPDEVPINPGLVAIIGGRGSGKTALADLIAIGSGSREPFENESSFVSRAGRLVGDAKAVVDWHSEEPTESALSGEPVEADWDDDAWEIEEGGRVRYLSQQFVEQLCASDGVSDELRTEIERVIYNSWPINERQGATDFKELLYVRLGLARDQQQTELGTIRQLGDEITSLRVLQHQLPRQKEQLAGAGRLVAQLDTQIKAIAEAGGSGHAARYGVVAKVLQGRLNEAQMLDRQRTDLVALANAIDVATGSQFPKFADDLKGRYPHAGLAAEDWGQFIPAFTGDPGKLVAARLAVVEQRQAELKGPEPTGEPQPLDGLSQEELEDLDISRLQVERNRLEQLVGLDTKRAEQLRRLQEQYSNATTQIKRLTTAIAEATDAETTVAELTSSRTRHYASYFGAVVREAAELKALYAPLREVLAGFGASVAKLSLSVKRSVSLTDWVTRGESLLDLRTTGTFRGSGVLLRIAREELLDAWLTGAGDDAAAAIQEFSSKYSSDLRKQSRVSADDEAAYREWERKIAHWIYSVDHITVTYGLEYDGVDIERLSPGTRGIVLLLLYLAVDQSETVPLIIDQPEENLDPESVQSELVGLFRAASARRQVIMVTHNANLVVNTDVDQVIVAHSTRRQDDQLPFIDYTAGGLENPAIRKAVCGVLEGGEEAFKQRARRLHIDASASLLDD